MTLLARLPLALVIASSLPQTAALSQQAAAPGAANPTELPLQDLPEDQLTSGLVKLHPIGLPSPTELLFILSKEGSPKWRKFYHPVPKTHPTDREKAALRLGLNLTEGHVAAIARDAQKIRDITADLERQAKTLGIGAGLAGAARSINRLAEARAWAAVAVEFEALGILAGQLLAAQLDRDLGKLIAVGTWVRLLHLSSSIVTLEDFSDASTAISSHWTLSQLSDMTARDGDAPSSPNLSVIHDQLAKLERLWHPDKLRSGHQFDDALIQASRDRLASAISVFAK